MDCEVGSYQDIEFHTYGTCKNCSGAQFSFVNPGTPGDTVLQTKTNCVNVIK